MNGEFVRLALHPTFRYEHELAVRQYVEAEHP